MKLKHTPTIMAIGAATLLSGCNSGNDSSSPAVGDYQYSTKAVYAARQAMNSYEVAPEGFSPVFTELVARHGSRSLSSPKYDVLTKLVNNWPNSRLAELTPWAWGAVNKPG